MTEVYVKSEEWTKQGTEQTFQHAVMSCVLMLILFFYLKCVIQGAGKIENQFCFPMKIIRNRTVAKMLAFNHLNE